MTSQEVSERRCTVSAEKREWVAKPKKGEPGRGEIERFGRREGRLRLRAAPGRARCPVLRCRSGMFP